MANTAMDVEDALELDGAPVAISFLQQPPEGVAPWDGGPVAAGCVFWQRARQGQTFYTVPAEHYNCAVGAHVHGMELPDGRREELTAVVELMAGAGYVDPGEVPSIPVVAEAPRYIAYGPAATVPFDADVVVVAATPAKAMLLHEAALRAGVAPMAAPATGRPGCAVLPLAMQSGQAALTLGCAGNRLSTGLRDEELYSAIPGPAWPAVVEALASIVQANATMDEFYRQRQDRVEVAAGAGPAGAPAH
jgi:uncharacterized protein (DUF169 family)